MDWQKLSSAEVSKMLEAEDNGEDPKTIDTSDSDLMFSEILDWLLQTAKKDPRGLEERLGAAVKQEKVVLGRVEEDRFVNGYMGKIAEALFKKAANPGK